MEVVVAELGILVLPRVVAAAAGGGARTRCQLVEDGVGIDLDPGRVAAGDHASELCLATTEAVEILEADRLIDGPPDLAALLVLGGRGDLDATEPLGPEHGLALVGDVVELPLEQVNHDSFGAGSVAERAECRRQQGGSKQCVVHDDFPFDLVIDVSLSCSRTDNKQPRSAP